MESAAKAGCTIVAIGTVGILAITAAAVLAVGAVVAGVIAVILLTGRAVIRNMLARRKKPQNDNA